MKRKKSTVAEIRARFDADVERFTNLETGQSATVDTPLAMELIGRAAAVKDAAFRDYVLDYVAKEDTPRPLVFQLDLLRDCGFRSVEILHKNNCFAAFGAVK